jgi:hypothetical protein
MVNIEKVSLCNQCGLLGPFDTWRWGSYNQSMQCHSRRMESPASSLEELENSHGLVNSTEEEKL